MVPYYQTVINTLKNTMVFIVFPPLKNRHKLKYFNCTQVGYEFGTALKIYLRSHVPILHFRTDTAISWNTRRQRWSRCKQSCVKHTKPYKHTHFVQRILCCIFSSGLVFVLFLLFLFLLLGTCVALLPAGHMNSVDMGRYNERLCPLVSTNRVWCRWKGSTHLNGNITVPDAISSITTPH